MLKIFYILKSYSQITLIECCCKNDPLKVKPWGLLKAGIQISLTKPSYRWSKLNICILKGSQELYEKAL